MIRLKFTAFILFCFMLMGCSDDDNDPQVLEITYSLTQANSSGISGTAKFEETDDGQVRLIISLNNIEADATHPAHIHYNSVSEGGDILVDLNSIQGSSGESITTFNQDIEGNPVEFSDISNLNAHINVHQNPNNLDVVAEGDIGSNVDNSSDNGNNGGSGGY